MIWAAKRVTFQGRSFLSTTGTVVLVPIATGPNEIIEGMAVTASLLTPAPATPSVRLEFEALLEKWSEPDVQLSDVGVKLTLTSTLCPASKTSRQAQAGRAEFRVAHHESRNRQTRLSSIRHGDQQGFGLTNNDTTKSKLSGCANKLRGSGARAYGHNAKKRDRQADG